MLFRLFDAHFIPHVRTYPNARVFFIRHFHYHKILPLRRLSVGNHVVQCPACHADMSYVPNKERKLRLLCLFCHGGLPRLGNPNGRSRGERCSDHRQPHLGLHLDTKIPLETPQKSNLDAKSAKIFQKSAFFFKNICTIQK